MEKAVLVARDSEEETIVMSRESVKTLKTSEDVEVVLNDVLEKLLEIKS
jgi:hypothetical protein